MRPTRGRPAGSKSKTCFVRLEKVLRKNDKEDEEEHHKKLTGPIKKRPVVMKPKAPRKKQFESSEDLSGYNLVTARTRRTPKPNPKYNNEEIVTSNFRGKHSGKDDYIDNFYAEDDEIVNNDSIMEDDNVPNTSGSDAAAELSVEEDEEEDSSEDDAPKRRPYSRPAIKIIPQKESPPPKRRGRPPKVRVFNTVERAAPETERHERSRLLEVLRKKKMEYEKEEEVESSIIARNKRLNIEFFDASDSDVPAPISPGGRRIIRSRQLTRPSETSIRGSSKLIESRDGSDNRKARMRLEREQAQIQSDDDNLELTTGAASTIDDFETMPTFTIVNINDIINKKGDVLIQKTLEEEANAAQQQSRSRRKSHHTTILSDRVDTSKIIPQQRTTFPPPSKPIRPYFNNNSLSKSMRPIISSAIEPPKPAPRILNAVIAKKQKPVHQPSVLNYASKPRISEQDSMDKGDLTRSKENLQTNTQTAGSVPRKLPQEKVVIQRQGNKLIKKITCFETWYVINIPDTDPPTPKNIFNMSIVELGNIIKDIQLPSNIWNFKVTLQKLSQNQLKSNYELYTGDIEDANVPDSEKHKYHPVNIMFRRQSQNPKLRMPYDRAVIFKNKTFFTNIDGKNIRLLGAPTTVNDQTDIETLLEVIDVMSLNDEFVEQTTFVL